MKYRNTMTAFFLFLILCAVPSQAERLTCIAPDGQYVNVRNRAFRGAATWGVLHAGDVIETNPDEIRNGFFKTTFKEREAYVSVHYFEIEEDGAYVVTGNGRVRMRKSPQGSTDGFIRPGERVRVMAWRYGEDGSLWARCTGGRYISADYLSPVQ